MSKKLKDRIAPPLVIVVIMWVLELIDFLAPGSPLDALGIRPRVAAALPSILLAPFLHGGFAHLATNTIPFVILGLLVTANSNRAFTTVFGQSMLIAGAGIWLFGAPGTIHIGASGIVFGLLGFLIVRGFIERSLTAILLSVIAIFLYGGMVFALVPVKTGVSWSGHLFGFIGGLVAAWQLPKRR